MEQEQKSNFDTTQQPRPTQKRNNNNKNNYPPNQDIKTLFVSGLPGDVREREIHNLFRFFSGYEGCIFNENPSKQMVAFVSFVDRDSALRAMRQLQEVRFDINSPQTLRINFAKSNSKIKRLSPHDLFPSNKRRNPPLFGGSYGYPPPYPPYAAPPPGYGLGSVPTSLIPWLQNNLPPSHSLRYPSPPSKVPPCSTLFVANIHQDVSERDLLRLFRTLAGFIRLKMSQKDGAPICFVEYSDIAYSTNAMHTYQGFPVGASPIRIEYARARMGESKHQLHTNNQEDPSLGGLQNLNNQQYSDTEASPTHSPSQRHIVDGDLRSYDSLGTEQRGGSGSPF